MKRLLITGVNPTSTPDALASWLTRFGPVIGVNIVRDGDARAPIAIVDMDISDAQASFIVSRIANYWHDGALVSASWLMHGDTPERRHVDVVPAKVNQQPPAIGHPDGWLLRLLRALNLRGGGV